MGAGRGRRRTGVACTRERPRAGQTLQGGEKKFRAPPLGGRAAREVYGRSGPCHNDAGSRTGKAARFFAPRTQAAPQGEMDLPSNSLLFQARAGREPAWRRLVDLYRPLIFGYLLRQGVEAQEAEDLTQE